MENNSLKKLNYHYQETKNLFVNERAQAKKHLYYAQLRLQFLEWLERSWMDEAFYKFETPAYDPNSLEESMAWQEAVVMLSNEIKDDELYVDIIGGTNNYAITFGLYAPQTKEEKEKTRAMINEVKKDHFSKDSMPYQERKKLDELFHSLMNMKPKESIFFHERYQEFKEMVKKHIKKGDTYQSVMMKLSKPGKNKKSDLEMFLSKKKKEA